MKISEYQSAHELCQRRQIIAMFLSIGVLFLTLGIGALAKYAFGLSDSAPTLNALIGPASVIIGFPLMLYGFRLTDCSYRHFPKLICPHCEGSLFNSKSVIIATGNCPKCGRRILKDGQIGT